jgi:hypothetical protein
LLQLFTVYVVPPDGTRDIAKYTIPFALGKKPKQHHHLLNEILRQTTELELVQFKYCGDSKQKGNVCFERVIIQNDYIERVNNLSIVQAGTYGKCWASMAGKKVCISAFSPNVQITRASWFEVNRLERESSMQDWETKQDRAGLEQNQMGLEDDHGNKMVQDS